MVMPNQRKDGAQCENGYLATQTLIQEGVPFTAIVARNDFLALGALRALKEAGLSVPQNVSVVGYTDSIHAVCADPPLTSVRTPIAEAGEIAVERLIRSIEDRESTFEGTMLPTTLEVRQSSAPCSGRS
jgi:DNA-binding LacI/PurR family transcriptional regulator